MRLKVLTVLMSCFICKPLNYQIAGRDTTASDLDFFRPINVNEMQANWDQATFRFIPFQSLSRRIAGKNNFSKSDKFVDENFYFHSKDCMWLFMHKRVILCCWSVIIYN